MGCHSLAVITVLVAAAAADFCFWLGQRAAKCAAHICFWYFLSKPTSVAVF